MAYFCFPRGGGRGWSLKMKLANYTDDDAFSGLSNSEIVWLLKMISFEMHARYPNKFKDRKPFKKVSRLVNRAAYALEEIPEGYGRYGTEDWASIIRKLEKECEALSHEQCLIKGSIVGDEGGTPYCKLKADIEKLRR